MTSNHLRPQAGGNPAQGPTPDVANPTPSPAAGNDLPDAPDDPDAPVQDRPDLDEFAERIGLRDASSNGTTLDDSKTGPRDAVERTVTAGGNLLTRALRRLSRGSEKLADRLQRH